MKSNAGSWRRRLAATRSPRLVHGLRTTADAANNQFVAPVGGTYLFGATLIYKFNSSTAARMRGLVVPNGVTEIQGSYGEISGAHVSEDTAPWLQMMVPPPAGDTVELQGYIRAQDGYFATDHTSLWGCKIG